MNDKVRVIVTGATGRMGKEVVKGILNDPELLLVGAIDLRFLEQDIGPLVGMNPAGVYVREDLKKTILESKPDVMVDFTIADAAVENAIIALENGVYPVIGTTGMNEEQLERIHLLCEQRGLAAVIAPNFAIGAVLMMRFAREAAKYFPQVEIIELHHDQKLDAPSGTALKTAEMLMEERQVINPTEDNSYEKIKGVRGGDYKGIRIHSIRLPGLVAHQEVIFGGLGQTLSLRHDSINRESFIPGVLLAIKKVKRMKGVIYGLENLLE
ncbi:4-hydroxy-tetrahydrodipicolinate reductase [Calderihabitans maritimus]|uniref:4-hydroxy-tetrahydrodipicolinate reductase n=1 Tax=Calderihabitans maritimus TaxID=1246530 RepID=A0A1Z5HQG3_9FIRM|nr:4-hydroxy-tetrahydrodipicolinate reductase [Calderihabitans maritimus]GAW91773.1 dihydrodipicolinate reductase [Calderihabitans maritimus]